MGDGQTREDLVKEIEAEYHRQNMLRYGGAMADGTSLLKPFQKKTFSATKDEVWTTYEVEGKPVHIKVADCINWVWAVMMVEALNDRQRQLEEEEHAQRKPAPGATP